MPRVQRRRPFFLFFFPVLAAELSYDGHLISNESSVWCSKVTEARSCSFATQRLSLHRRCHEWP